MENMNQQQQHDFQHQEQTQKQNQQIRVCKHCNATLDEDMAFCPECGEKVGGEERICPICKTSSTSEFCPNCGQRLIPLVCTNCGKESFSDFCDECGTVLNVALQQMIQQPEQQIQQMSQEEAESIKREAEQSITPELQQFLKKIEEHRILLEERGYFNNREKRIIKVFGQNPLEVIEQSPEEKAFMTKMYEGLRKTVIARQKKDIDDKIRKLFPDLEDDSKIEEEKRKKAEQLKQEAEAKRLEMEKRYNELLAGVTDDVKKAQIAEQKRIEEERLRKEAEERERRRREEEERERQKRERQRKLARIRAEQEARDNAILGNYIYDGVWFDKLTVSSRSGSRISGTIYSSLKTSHGESVEKFTGNIVGNEITLNVIKADLSGAIRAYASFHGTIQDEIISGHWTFVGTSGIASVTYYKY